MEARLALLLSTGVLACLIFGQTPNTEEIFKTAEECFQTVWFSYSNPEVTSTSKLDLHYRNDLFQTKVLSLSCKDQDLYVDISQIKLSLPQKGESRDYCQESAEKTYPSCTSKKPCLCCKVPDSRCSIAIQLTDENIQACTNRQMCNITVKSDFLTECPGREYTCEGRKCHSRWVDVQYYCRPIDKVRMKELLSAGVQVPWWAIVLICVGCPLILCMIWSCYKKFHAGNVQYNISKENNNYEFNGDQDTTEEEKCPGTGYGRNMDEGIPMGQSLPVRGDYGIGSYSPNISRSSTLKSQSSRTKVKQMACPPPPPPTSVTNMSTGSEPGTYSMETDPRLAAETGEKRTPETSSELSELQQRFRDMASRREDEQLYSEISPKKQKPALPTKPQINDHI